MITDKAIFDVEASKYLKLFAESHSEFMTEDVRLWAYSKGMDEPVNQSWWGNVSRAAAKRGDIEFIGLRKSKTVSGTRYNRFWKSKLI